MVDVEMATFNMNKLFLSAQSSDLKIMVKTPERNHCYPVHAHILAGESRIIRNLIKHDWERGFSRSIVIEDFTPETVKRMLRFCYSGQVDNREVDELISLLKLAHLYKMRRLRRITESILLDKVTILNVLKLYQISRKCKMFILENRCRDLICAWGSVVIEMEEFASLDVESAKKILSSSCLNVKSEIEVYEAAWRWIKEVCSTKNLCICSKHIVQEGKELFRCVRYELLNSKEKVRLTNNLCLDKLFSVMNQGNSGRIAGVGHMRIQFGAPSIQGCLSLQWSLPDENMLPRECEEKTVLTFFCTKEAYLFGFRGLVRKKGSDDYPLTLLTNFHDIDNESSETLVYDHSLPSSDKIIGDIYQINFLLNHPKKIKIGGWYKVVVKNVGKLENNVWKTFARISEQPLFKDFINVTGNVILIDRVYHGPVTSVI